MSTNDPVVSFSALPDNATYEEAAAWLNRMRRLVDRWDDLPGSHDRSMTPEGKRQVNAELDLFAEMIGRDTAFANT